MTTRRHDLRIDLVPRSSWGSNVRTLMKTYWPEIREFALTRAGGRCECCDKRGFRGQLDVHELWAYEAVDALTGIQRLADVVALCNRCHEVHHWGLARTRGREHLAREQIAAVRGWSDAEIDRHVNESFRVWSRRNALTWLPDLSWITENLGHEVPGPHELAGASAAAVEKTHLAIAGDHKPRATTRGRREQIRNQPERTGPWRSETRSRP
jgi:hypothetical protein